MSKLSRESGNVMTYNSPLAVIYTWNVFKALSSLTSNKGQLLSTKDKTTGPKRVLSSEVQL